MTDIERTELDRRELDRPSAAPDEGMLIDGAEVERPPEAGEAASGGGLGIQILRVFVQNKLAVAGVVIIVLMVLFCFVGPYLYPTNQVNGQLALNNPINAAPSAQYPLGTDNNGFNILGRLMFAGKASLIVGFLSALMATIVGTIWGSVAGFFSGWPDSAMMRFVDVCLSVPPLYLLIALVTILQSPSEWLLIIVIAAVSWLIPARLIRGETLTLRTRDYVHAVRSMGGTRRRIIGRHIVPNAVGTIVVFATFQVADSILFLAALGFIGLGIPPPNTDWGSMLSNGVESALAGYWWQIYPAGFCIIIVVVAFNFIGDALRDALEVRLQRR